jgi:hypothetical protein
MSLTEIDGFIAFENVRVVGATAQAVQCRIGNRVVWFPRIHVSGNLEVTRQTCRMLVRRWVAHDRHLVALGDVTHPTSAPSWDGRRTSSLCLLPPRKA